MMSGHLGRPMKLVVVHLCRFHDHHCGHCCWNVRTAKKALCSLEEICGFVKAYLISLQLSSIAAFTSL